MSQKRKVTKFIGIFNPPKLYDTCDPQERKGKEIYFLSNIEIRFIWKETYA